LIDHSKPTEGRRRFYLAAQISVAEATQNAFDRRVD
jgi:hypothetical protein